MSASLLADGKGSKSSYLARRSKIVSFSLILTVIQLVYQSAVILKRAVREMNFDDMQAVQRNQ